MAQCSYCKQNMSVTKQTYKKIKKNGSIFYVPKRIASSVMDIVEWHFEKGTHIICGHCQTLTTLDERK